MRNRLKTKFIPLMITLLIIPVLVLGFSGPANAESSGKLPMFIAGSLTVPFAAATKEYNKLSPKVEVLTESGGSASMIRKVTDLKKECV